MTDHLRDLIHLQSEPGGSMSIQPGPATTPLGEAVIRQGDHIWIETPDGRRIRHKVTGAGPGWLNLAIAP